MPAHPASPPAGFGAARRVKALNLVFSPLIFIPLKFFITYLPASLKMVVRGEEGSEKLHLAWVKQKPHSSVASIKKWGGGN